MYITSTGPPDLSVAFGEFPELRQLADLLDAGWAFLPTIVDGEVTQLHGVRMWRHGWADAIRVRCTSDAMAVRCDYDGGLVWERAGGLSEVVDALVALPAPDMPGAPRLVKGAAPALWAP